MAWLSDAEKDALAQQIQQAEQESGAEIVTVIAHRSDDYRYFAILWAALIALAVPGVMYLFGIGQQSSNWTPIEQAADSRQITYVAQALVFLFLAIVFQWEPLRLRLVPDHIKRMRASRHARSQFIAQRVHWTSHGAGILIFVSVAEHYVEIIVDQAIGQATDQSTWQTVVDAFIDKVRHDQVATGFSATVAACQKILQDNHDQISSARINDVPAKNANQLPDRLIEI